MATLSVQRTAQRAFSLKEWTKAKSTCSLSRPLQKDGSSNPRANFSLENLHIQKTFVSLQRQNLSKSCATDERELVNHPSSFAFQPHKILTAAFQLGFLLFRSIITEVLTNTEAQPFLRLYPAVPGNVKTSA